MENNDKIGKLGKPSLIFGPGQKRRFNLVKRYIDLKDKKILDVGCGVGVYTERFSEEGKEVYGIDIDPERIKSAQKLAPKAHFLVAGAENLPFSDNFFDIVFLHEILEHVHNDKKAVLESLRVLKPQGQIIIFVPNRLYFFETHGIYLSKKYIYQLIPFVNWLPKIIRNFFCPHVRVYSKRELKNLFKELNPVGIPEYKVEFLVIDYIYPALDKFSKRHPALGKILRKLFDFAERNWLLSHFGISIFAIIKKI